VKQVLVLGAGGHAQVTVDILQRMQEADRPVTPIGYLDDDESLREKSFLGLPVWGRIEDLSRIPHDAIIIGIGNNQVRQRLFKALQMQGEKFVTAHHPSAVISPDVRIGSGSVICAQVAVNTGSVIGDNVILNTGCTVDHHNRIVAHTHIAPGAHLGGEVEIGEGVLIGIGAVIMPQCHIGPGTIVGAGALVHQNLPGHVTAYGIPAQIIDYNLK
jgi:sugar O-acyltransferase (sialic acid O-acetyltransferase NeuD family)